ncbi:hypothetical protein [Lysinibacillus sp. NPDC086135]|uniref:hypothetical protein n=1 Tax=Lysinibacillus sp. NPDC086135 TaxID=3364130 RepID=UPI0037F41EAC
MNIEQLIQRGLGFKGNINKTTFTNFSEWTTECTLYLQDKYNSNDSTKQFIEKSNSIIDIYLSEEIVLEDTLNYIIGLLQGVKNHEEKNSEQWDNFFEEINK